MALIKSVRGFTPQIGKDTFLADNATIIGDVEIGEGCSIWFGTVRRCVGRPQCHDPRGKDMQRSPDRDGLGRTGPCRNR